MNSAPACRVLSLGELTLWGKQILAGLQTAKIIDVAYEASLQKYLESANPAEPHVIFIEGTAESKVLIQKLRGAGRHCFILWYGRTFTKDDLLFAIDQRVFCVFENARADDKRIIESIHKLLNSVENGANFERIIRSVKAILLQEENEVSKPVLTEIKTAIGKLERFGLQNEFSGISSENFGAHDAKIPFHRAQDYGDALQTVHSLERTGALWVRGSLPGEEGKVEFLQGKITAALAGDVHGLKAIYRMFLWDNPRFLFTRKDPRESIVAEQLNLSMKYICSEGADQKRRYDRIRKELPPAEVTLELEPKSLHVNASLNPNEFQTLASVVELGRVSQVLDYNPLPDVHLYESLIRLRKINMIRVAS